MTADLSMVYAAARAGRAQEAYEGCRGVLENDPQNAEAWNLMGVLHGMQGDHVNAASCMERAVGLAPGVPEYRKNLCRAYLEVGDVQAAEHAIGDLPPDADADLLRLYATVQARQNRFDAAIQTLQAAVKVNSRNPAIWFALSEMYRLSGSNADSISSLQELLKIDDRYEAALNNLAGLQLFEGHFLEAMRTVQRLLETNPRSAQAYCNLGALLSVAGDLPQAEVALRNALTLQPQLFRAEFMLANVLIDLGRLEESQHLLEGILASRKQFAVQAITTLARIQERRGNIDQAAELLSQLDSSQLRNPQVAIVQATVLEQQGRQDEAISTLNSVLENAKVAAEEGVGIYFLLGQLLDKTGQYEEAFAAFRKGNENRRRAFFQYDTGESKLPLEQINELFTKSNYLSCPSSGCESEIPIFIIGMPRSGTSLVEQILASHPAIAAAGEVTILQDLMTETYDRPQSVRPLEITAGIENCNLVPRGWGHNTAEEIRFLADQYLQRIGSLVSGDASRITDKLPYNFLIAPIIHRVFPKARIIHCTRSGMDTCLSCYFQNFSTGNQFAFDLEDLARYYCNYVQIMEKWKLELQIPMKNVVYEELVKDPQETVREMLDYCSVDWFEGCLEFHISKRTVHTASYQQIRRPLYSSSVGKWRHYREFLGPLMSTIQATLGMDAVR